MQVVLVLYGGRGRRSSKLLKLAANKYTLVLFRTECPKKARFGWMIVPLNAKT